MSRFAICGLSHRTAPVEVREKLVAHRNYIREYGIDMPEILNFTFFDEKK